MILRNRQLMKIKIYQYPSTVGEFVNIVDVLANQESDVVPNTPSGS